tara:strand:+ start:348 stop:611 length:264 start_codon:yes stop_codon:yes gene_type:complete
MNLNKQNLINKIIYRAQYRGTKEMDIFLSSFVKSIINTLSINELNDLNDIIKLDDESLKKLSNGDLAYRKLKNNKISKKLIEFKKKY